MKTPKTIKLTDDAGALKCSMMQLNFIIDLSSKFGYINRLGKNPDQKTKEAFQKQLSVNEASKLIDCLRNNEFPRFKEL